MPSEVTGTLRIGVILLIVSTCSRSAVSQPSNLLPQFELPQNGTTIRKSIERCADWLSSHAVRGLLESCEYADKATLSVIAWKDPTLLPEQPNVLAGYLITDTLWASVALRELRPQLSRELLSSLEKLNHTSNGLHEVLWSKVDALRHRSADFDRVHGASVGKLYLSCDRWVDLRVFNMQLDAAFTVGHPKLFAEHAAYQALFEFWHGDVDKARDRIRRILKNDPVNATQQTIFWDNNRRVLVDHLNIDEWREMEPSRSTCRIFAFKLATVAYAARILNLEQEFLTEIDGIGKRLWECQLYDGGIAHFARIDMEGELVACKDATGEATAVAILCNTVQPIALK